MREFWDLAAQRQTLAPDREAGELGYLHLGALGRGYRHVEFAEGPRVDVAQFIALGEGEHDVGVLGLDFLGALGVQQLSAHPQVDYQVIAALETDD